VSADLIFSICNSAVLPGWLLLIVLPKWKWTLALISTVIIPFVLGLVYVGLFISQASNFPEGGGLGSLEALIITFANPYILTAAWIHYLAFDLFVGAWEVGDAQKQGISHWLVIPCLVLTFMAGPTGLALYFILRFAMTKKILLVAPASA
jgi:hypothetical protein